MPLAPWLEWWAWSPDTEEGLAFKEQEAAYLSRWKTTVNEAVGITAIAMGCAFAPIAAPRFNRLAPRAC